MTGIPIGDRDLGTHGEDGQDCGRDGYDAAISQGMPGIAGSHQKLDKARKDTFLEPSEHPLASRTVRQSAPVF